MRRLKAAWPFRARRQLWCGPLVSSTVQCGAAGELWGFAGFLEDEGGWRFPVILAGRRPWRDDRRRHRRPTPVSAIACPANRSHCLGALKPCLKHALRGQHFRSRRPAPGACCAGLMGESAAADWLPCKTSLFILCTTKLPRDEATASRLPNYSSQPVAALAVRLGSQYQNKKGSSWPLAHLNASS